MFTQTQFVVFWKSFFERIVSELNQVFFRLLRHLVNKFYIEHVILNLES